MGFRSRLARRWGARDLEAQLAGWPVKGRVIVNRKTGTGDLRGVLWEVTPNHLILRQAELVGAGDPDPIDGEVLIERDEVEFIQIIKR